MIATLNSTHVDWGFFDVSNRTPTRTLNTTLNINMGYLTGEIRDLNDANKNDDPNKPLMYAQYGTSRSEEWFQAAAIHLQSPDGTYQIVCQNLDESDPTSSRKHPSESKLIAIARTIPATIMTMLTTTTTMSMLMTTMLTTRSAIALLGKQIHPPTPFQV
jgi:hypothetical protein